MADSLDPNAFVERLFSLYGGRDAAFEAIDRRFEEVARRWDQDVGAMGRILRCHLFVEYYLTRYLQARNPNLGDLDQARLSFAQKLALVDRTDRSVAFLISGIHRLNIVRNRLSHTLQAEVNPEDRRVFLSVSMFRALREEGARSARRKASARPAASANDPIVVLEDFAKFAGNLLESASNPESQLWEQAIRETMGTDSPSRG